MSSFEQKRIRHTKKKAWKKGVNKTLSEEAQTFNLLDKDFKPDIKNIPKNRGAWWLSVLSS